jgi:hypothetical protein
MMRTTVTLDETLLEALKRRALDERRTLSDVVAEAARAWLAADGASAPFELVTFGEGGLRAGVSLTSFGALLAADDEPDYGQR